MVVSKRLMRTGVAGIYMCIDCSNSFKIKHGPTVCNDCGNSGREEVIAIFVEDAADMDSYLSRSEYMGG